MQQVIIMISVVILSIFLLDNLGLLWANGMDFLRNPFCVLDLFVVIVSIYFEMSHGGNDWVGILVMARSWRFIRIGHGLYELNHGEHEHVEGHDSGHLDDAVTVHKGDNTL